MEKELKEEKKRGIKRRFERSKIKIKNTGGWRIIKKVEEKTKKYTHTLSMQVPWENNSSLKNSEVRLEKGKIKH